MFPFKKYDKSVKIRDMRVDFYTADVRVFGQAAFAARTDTARANGHPKPAAAVRGPRKIEDFLGLTLRSLLGASL